VILKTSTLLRLRRALVKRTYHHLYTPRRCGCPGPKGPYRELIEAVVGKTAQPGLLHQLQVLLTMQFSAKTGIKESRIALAAGES